VPARQPGRLVLEFTAEDAGAALRFPRSLRLDTTGTIAAISVDNSPIAYRQSTISKCLK
jgi:hypothetical protein